MTALISVGSLGAGHTSYVGKITFTGADYNYVVVNPTIGASGTQFTCTIGGIPRHMAANDTASVVVTVSNSTKTVSVLGTGSALCRFFGVLVT